MGQTLDDRLVLRALRSAAIACEANGHRECGGVELGSSAARCQQLAREHECRADERLRAEQFDAGQVLLERGVAMPDLSWPVAALLRLVHDELLRGPWQWTNPLRRGIAVTSALARLGELGLPSDALVRGGLGADLVRQITISAVFSRCGSLGMAEGDELAGMEDWVDALAECRDVHAGAELEHPLSFAVLLACAGHGDFSRIISEWLETASMRDLVGWRLDATPGGVTDGDRSLRGGHEAAKWLWDRFVHTDLTRWARTSLEWELRWAHDPDHASRQSGVPAHVLHQRVVLSMSISRELARRLAQPGEHDTIVMGLSRYEVHGLVISALSAGQSSRAVAFLRLAVQDRPEDDALRNVLGFALVAHDPAEAADLLHRLVGADVDPVDLVAANRASAAVRCGDLASAVELLSPLAASGGDEFRAPAVLWAPEALLDVDHPLSQLRELGVATWAAELLALIGAECGAIQAPNR